MDIFFDGWEGLIRILVSAPLVYIAVIVFTRLAGKRSTSQMNNFDWIVTVAIGSLVGSTIILESMTVGEGLFAIALLFVLQYVATLASRHSTRVEDVIKSSPKLLFENGRFLEPAMDDERITRNEVLAAIRESGYRHLEEVQYVILESDAQFSVIARGPGGIGSDVLNNVRREEPAE